MVHAEPQWNSIVYGAQYEISGNYVQVKYEG